MKTRLRFVLVAFAAALVLGVVAIRHATAQSRPPSAAAGPAYIVEWVYRAKWGFKDEFFQIFKKYQVPVLDRYYFDPGVRPFQWRAAARGTTQGGADRAGLQRA